MTTQPITIHISVTDINQTSNNGAGAVVSSSQLNASSLNLTLRGTGNFDIKLNATQITTQLSGVRRTYAAPRPITQQRCPALGPYVVTSCKQRRPRLR